MMVEGIAQFAVLIFRLGGIDAKNKGDEVMQLHHINKALQVFQNKLIAHQNAPVKNNESKIISVQPTSKVSSDNLFSEVSEEMNLNFENIALSGIKLTLVPFL